MTYKQTLEEYDEMWRVIEGSLDDCGKIQRECGVTELDFVEKICVELACYRMCSELNLYREYLDGQGLTPD
jgi:hypothetical protein